MLLLSGKDQVIEAVRTLVKAEPVMLPQGVRFECSREQKIGGSGGAGTIGFARYPFAGAFFLEDMFFGFSG